MNSQGSKPGPIEYEKEDFDMGPYGFEPRPENFAQGSNEYGPPSGDFDMGPYGYGPLPEDFDKGYPKNRPYPEDFQVPPLGFGPPLDYFGRPPYGSGPKRKNVKKTKKD